MNDQSTDRQLSPKELEAIDVFNKAIASAEIQVKKMRWKEDLFFYTTVLARIVNILVGLSIIFVIFNTWK